MEVSGIIVASLVIWAGITSAQNITVGVTVAGNQGPWLWVNGGLNTAYQYDNVFGEDYTAPTVVSTNNGFHFTPGDNLTISYVSGSVSVGPGTGWPYVDANGDTNTVAFGYLTNPSYYMSHASNVYISELVGTFADGKGEIVGTPFAIGDGGVFTIPIGATQIQLGVDDVGYGDNVGSWNIDIGPESVPEPATTSLVLIGLGGLGLATRRCRRSVVR
jgi:hypothetical protein